MNRNDLSQVPEALSRNDLLVNSRSGWYFATMPPLGRQRTVKDDEIYGRADGQDPRETDKWPLLVLSYR
jgi:hypothetical protein